MYKARWISITEFFTEAGHEAVSHELKDKLISVIHDNQEEAHLDVEDIEEELNGEFEFDVRKEWDNVEEMK